MSLGLLEDLWLDLHNGGVLTCCGSRLVETASGSQPIDLSSMSLLVTLGVAGVIGRNKDIE